MVETNMMVAELVDIVAATPHLKDYILRRSAGADATLSGAWVNTSGAQIGVSVTGTVGATAQKLSDILGAIPVTAAGFRGRLSGADIIFTIGLDGAGAAPSTIVTDMTNNPTRYPLMATSDDFRLGRA